MSGNVFDLLEPKLKRVVRERFTEPTPIQEEVIPEILEGRNTLIISETGSGKTESALLPVFNRMERIEHKPIAVLYITPLKSLNRDLWNRIMWWAKKLEFDVSVRHGDTTQYERSMQVENPPEMMISTPETLQAILVGKRMREHLKNVKMVVVDEVHELVGSKRGVQLSVALERLRELAQNPRMQVVGLSATVGSPERVAAFLTGGRECKTVNTVRVKELKLGVECPVPGRGDAVRAKEMYVSPGIAARLGRMVDIMKERNSVLAFSNTRGFAEVLSSRLKAFDPELKLDAHHSSLSKQARIETENAFRDGKLKAIVCTSSLELGIDIGSIDYIIQYSSPRQASKLLQRVGRSGHSLSRKSVGSIIASDPDDCFEASVIARQALEGKVEPTKVYGPALDVLCHQIVGMAMEEYNVPFEKVCRVIRRSYPFRHVTKERMMEMCDFLQRLRYVWINDTEGEMTLKRSRKVFDYYFRNMSTIPDVRNYAVIDIISKKPVGFLDQEFVALHARPGVKFICKGRPWRMLEVQERKITAEPAQGVEGAIPSWEGELMPVPYDVAQGVGRLREELAGRQDVSKYPIDKDVRKALEGNIGKQGKWGAVPTCKEVVIEHGEKAGKDYMEQPLPYVIIHSCFGSLINDTLGRALSILIMNRMGSIGLKADPYRITFKFPYGLEGCLRDVEGALEELDPERMKEILELSMPNTELFRWKFVQVAKRFGIISRDADLSKAYLKKIIEVYEGTPVWEETMNEIWQEKLDLEGAKKALRQLKEGGLRITKREGLSPMGEYGLSSRHEVMAEARPEREIFEAFKERLLETRMNLVCTNCGFSIKHTVKDLPKEIQCHSCKARMMAPIKDYERDKELALKAKIKGTRKLTEEEEKMVNALLSAASMVVASGPVAVKVFAGRGVGPSTAARILARMSEGDELLKDILEAERTFARTKQYWG